MRERILRILTKLTRWLTGAKFLPIPQEVMEILPAAKALVFSWELNETDFDGEQKRSQVYSRLCKVFPRIDKRYISVAIEVALLEKFNFIKEFKEPSPFDPMMRDWTDPSTSGRQGEWWIRQRMRDRRRWEEEYG